ncbi:uncharacterized protein K452DRAFT_308371 [Aplosporella prunicola CBS 121167]|uniref:Uncharacterized protein n=1 Tax=Aplosporella prunicola CBS 121167 TaxID=1176127 RepID=A0A6A6BCL4_9PEZI|nr:uncharacterized protein K452DRAFT_308371 [Aplosporella prunicola CBS 121167]KAF2141952.1 hypothetical protein K452DRAFT_308371 [Aplosporella prunicola CBS 121167]
MAGKEDRLVEHLSKILYLPLNLRVIPLLSPVALSDSQRRETQAKGKGIAASRRRTTDYSFDTADARLYVAQSVAPRKRDGFLVWPEIDKEGLLSQLTNPPRARTQTFDVGRLVASFGLANYFLRIRVETFNVAASGYWFGSGSSVSSWSEVRVVSPAPDCRIEIMNNTSSKQMLLYAVYLISPSSGYLCCSFNNITLKPSLKPNESTTENKPGACFLNQSESVSELDDNNNGAILDRKPTHSACLKKRLALSSATNNGSGADGSAPITSSSRPTLLLTGQFFPHLALEFHWSALDPATLTQHVTYGTNHEQGVKPLMLARSTLTITLTRRCAPSWEPWFKDRPQHNATLLLDSAFTPRNLDFTLEEGHFPAPIWAPDSDDETDADDESSLSHCRFVLRLRLPVSPYPPEATWDDDPPGPGSSREPWKWGDFVSRKLPDPPKDKP